MKKILLFSLLLFPNIIWAQRGVDGAKTISATTIVNEYTSLTANAAAGATSLTVNNNGLNTNNRFGAGNILAQGDLIMIYQSQGATMDATPEPFGAYSMPNTSAWGAILSLANYNNAGNYEFAEVVSVAGSNTITISCGLRNSYTASGHAQVIRVPRYTTLTVTGTGILTGDAWNGTVGGIVAVEVDGATTINGGGVIHANNLGFRGGLCQDNTTVNGGGYFASNNDVEGAEKGESVGGYTTEYVAVLGRYCKGAPANGGGGGTASNSGGGGGANGGTGNWTGNGIQDPNAAYAAAWAQEAGFVASASGGGRGGYSHSGNNANAATTPPGNGSWGGDSRRVSGGLGGRPMDYSTGKIFFGGGGGAGEQNNGYGGGGGLGGGIVYILGYGNVSGNGQINANGQNGLNSLTPAPGVSGYTGHDGAGGAGGGGAIIVNTTGTVSGITLNANGGQGGNANLLHGAFHTSQDAYGPGGGGGGGYIAVSNGTPTRTANGGNNGTTNGSGLSEFPPNGATRGTAGTNNAAIEDYSFTVTNDTICSGGSVTITATINGTVPPGTTLTWYTQQFGGSSVGTGTSYTTPVLASTTTYYVGFCPGWYRIPVTIVVGSNPSINTTNMVINDETCAGNDGSISGIVVTGGSGTLTYTWNGNSSANADLSNALAGNYTLVVTDASGCSSTSGPHTIGSGGGPVINTSNMTLTHTSCGNNDGSITGITVSGGTGSLTLEWNGNVVSVEDILNLAAGSYTFTVTDGIGCSSSAGPFTVNPSSNPAIDTTNMVVSDATCGNINGSITGIVTTGGSGSNVITWNGNVNPTEDIFNLPGGTYTLVVTDGNGCFDTEGPITINSLDGPVIDDSNIILTDATCSQINGSITGITVTGGNIPLTYEWNGITSATEDTLNIGGGSYTLVVTDNIGCSATSGPYTINATTNPTASASGTDVSCFGLSDGSALASATGGDGNYSYQWTGGPATDSYSGIPAGTYTVLVTDGNGCQSGAVVTINEPAEIIGSVSGNTLLCAGDNTTLTASGSTQFSWNTGDNTAAITVSPADDTLYSVIVSDGTCSDTVDVNVIVNDLPVAGITGDSSLCESESTTLTASGGMSYLWSTGDTSSVVTITPITSGTITVTVTNNCGTDNAGINLTVNNPPNADAGADQTITLGNSTTLNGSGGVIYLWTPSSGLSCTNCASPSADPTTDTEYILFVTDANGCSDSDTVRITVEEEFVIFIPDAFSPNGDGNNEMLYVRGEGIENFVFKLYDRWGQMVFETTDVNNGWDGVFKGVALNEGVFVYILEGNFLGGETFNQKGNITLHK